MSSQRSWLLGQPERSGHAWRRRAVHAEHVLPNRLGLAELESALIAERVQAGMAAAKARGRHVGRPATSKAVTARVEQLAQTTDLSVRGIYQALADQGAGEAGVSRSVVGRIVKEVRAVEP